MDIGEINRRVIEQFRSGGEIDGMNRAGLLLLTTAGARSGLRRTSPMMFHRDGGRLIVIASNMGAPRHPSWYHNLLAHPRVTVEIGDETYQAVAAPVTGEERERLWSLLKERYPFFIDHERTAERVIPLVALERAPKPGHSA